MKFPQTFSLNLQHPKGHDVVTTVKSLIIYIYKDLINMINTLLKEIQWIKKERHESINEKREFSLPGEQSDEEKNWDQKGNSTTTRDEIAYNILKYISCEGILA